MKRYDKSLIEVWKWKEKVYQDTKKLTTEDYLEKLKGDVKSVLSEHHAKLTPIYMKKKLQKVA